MRMKAGPARRALQERLKVQSSLSFNDTVVVVVAQQQEEAEATGALTKRHEPLNVTEDTFIWLNVIRAFEAYQRAARHQIELVRIVPMPAKQKLLLPSKR